MKKRLFTFGCSFTMYGWPTWADFLGIEYDDHENWAWIGLGNRAIAERVAEAHVKHQFNKNDTVIVQWSTHLRHDWYNEIPIIQPWAGWQTNGNIFNVKNRKILDDRWCATFFSERAFVMHSLNHMILVKNLLENTGCQWRFTSLGDFKRLGNDLAICGHGEDLFVDDDFDSDLLIKRFPEFNCYIEKLWNEHDDHWIIPLIESVKNHPELTWKWKAETDKEEWSDRHPTPAQHVKWLNDQLRPSLGLQDTWCYNIQNDLLKVLEESKTMDFLKTENFFKDTEGRVSKEFSKYKMWPKPKLGF